MGNPRVSIHIAHLSIRLQDTWVLHDVSLQCAVGEWTLIHGPTGAGKSTLLRAINGLCLPTHGRIWTLGTRIPGRRRHQARTVWRQTGTVLQDLALFETKTALENVILALRAAGMGRAAARARALAWLERFHVGEKATAYPCHLSGGERQRVALARALAPQPRVLVLDEPTSALDREMAQVVLHAVKECSEQGATVVMASHRVEETLALCDQHIELRSGRVWQIEPSSSPS